MKDITIIGITVILLWGLWGFFYKYGVVKLGFARAIMITSVVYTMLNIIIIAYLFNSGIRFPMTVDAGVLALGTIFGVSAGLLFIFALQKYPGSIIIPLTALYPAVAAVLAILILKEQIKAINALGIILAIVAGFLLTK